MHIQLQTGVGVFVHLQRDQNQCTPFVRGEQDWSYAEVLFDSRDKTEVRVNCGLGGWGTVAGRAWFDDLRIELVARKTFRQQPPSFGAITD